MAIGLIQEEKKYTNIAPLDFRHTLISGETGSGKTISCIYPNIKDRIQKGHSLFIFSYKGNEAKYIKKIAKDAKRLQDVYEFGKPTGDYFNLLQTINMKTFVDYIRNSYKTADPYWINTASSWLQAIHSMEQKLKLFQEKLKEIQKEDPVIEDVCVNIFNMLKLNIKNIRNKNNVIPISIVHDFTQELSFHSLMQITKSPFVFVSYIKALKRMFIELDNEIESLIKSSECDKDTLFMLHSFYLQAKRDSETIIGLNFEIDSTSSSGNNGVLEMLNNILVELGVKDYINYDENNILELLNKGKIVIIDTEGLPDFILATLFIAVMERLARRVKLGYIEYPVSVFIDEANKVLSPVFELYNDVLREAKVELFLAFQNEDQMKEKFSPTKWESFKQNFIHFYHIEKNKNFNLKYNGEGAEIIEPYIISSEELNNAEADFNNISRNKECILNHFIASSLPDKFNIIYSSKYFDENNGVTLIDLETGQSTEIIYYLKEHKDKFEEIYKDNVRFILNDDEDELYNIDRLEDYDVLQILEEDFFDISISE
ncbi:type IV secretory system conjugative DNA transfer family protein [Hydrogenimonas thermophila]|nr:type IV secretory system conjugative DNA transfer family protein [Hydrogenimonas thermophila]WOE68906.1 type IV secretory system conjugative DNA transfer family protein [Hydrogenimonas thermophila]WOE71413.1 type IV secretory system conjugative DNA transfer family protein [Hydrogenimonas thermophila]